MTNLRFNTGAPPWATITDGFPPEAYLGQRELNPAVLEAISNFWYDRSGIQDEYIAAIAIAGQAFQGRQHGCRLQPFQRAVAWLESAAGLRGPTPLPLLPPGHRRDHRCPRRLPCWTGFYMPPSCGYPDLGVHDLHHLVFMEAGLLRQVTDFPTHLGLPVSSYPNLVLSIHTYTHVFSSTISSSSIRTAIHGAGTTRPMPSRGGRPQH